MARKYDVHGTKDFIIWAMLLAALGLWCVKDGWFPSQTVLDRHPRQVQITAEADGFITEITLERDQTLAEHQVVGKLTPPGATEPLTIKTPVKGEVVAVSAKKNNEVKRGEVLAVVIPQDSFYAFNKTTAILTLLGAAVCAFVHRAVR